MENPEACSHRTTRLDTRGGVRPLPGDRCSVTSAAAACDSGGRKIAPLIYPFIHVSNLICQSASPYVCLFSVCLSVYMSVCFLVDLSSGIHISTPPSIHALIQQGIGKT